MRDNLAIEVVATMILVVRGQKVMIDRDLAELYGVSTKALNQAVKRNSARFPSDFMYKLTISEKIELVTNRDRFRMLKYSTSLPHVFTQEGVAMLSSVLNSERAIEVNIAIMRAFVKMRELLLTHKELTERIVELERRYSTHDQKIIAIFEVIKQMLEPMVETEESDKSEKIEKPPIGFR